MPLKTAGGNTILIVHFSFFKSSKRCCKDQKEHKISSLKCVFLVQKPAYDGLETKKELCEKTSEKK